MRRETIDFETFKENFIDVELWGYFPVDSAISEDDDGEYQKSVDIDMICQWRLTDGKVKFVVVPFETQEQLDQISAWLLKAPDALKEEIVESINKHVVDEGKRLFK